MSIVNSRKAQLRSYVKAAKPGDVIHCKGLEEMAFVQELVDKRYGQAEVSDGSSADYYKLPRRCSQLQDLIAYRNMNGQMAEIFRATFRYGVVPHSPKERDLKKIIYYAKAELERLKKYETINVMELDVGDL